jgi:peptide/nickel transport system ATP-binding protein
MYAGRIAEQAPVRDLFRSPRHPYTHGLIRSLPTPETPAKTMLTVIEGVVPKLTEMPLGCRFSNRCTFATQLCGESDPALEVVKEDHLVACHHWRTIER